jgi:hypothetical protein
MLKNRRCRFSSKLVRSATPALARFPLVHLAALFSPRSLWLFACDGRAPYNVSFDRHYHPATCP